MKKRWRATSIALTALALTLLLGACGGGGGGDQVASLANDSASGSNDGGSGGGDAPTKQETEDAFRKYARCMREHGIDMPDPQFSEDGKGMTFEAGPAAGQKDADPGKFEAADTACQKYIEGVAEARGNLDPEEEKTMQDRALKFAKCMRKHGIDMPDPQFDGGRVTQEIGAGGSGPDPDDPKFQDAQETCSKQAGMPKPGKGGGLTVDGPGRGSSAGASTK